MNKISEILETLLTLFVIFFIYMGIYHIFSIWLGIDYYLSLLFSMGTFISGIVISKISDTFIDPSYIYTEGDIQIIERTLKSIKEKVRKIER